MRSLFAKLFLCMLLVPTLARGGGLLLATALGESRPELGHGLAAALPLYAEAVGAAMEQGGPAAADAMLSAATQRTNLKFALRELPPGEDDCRRWAAHLSDGALSHRTLAVPIPDARSSGPACLAASLPPRPRILGVLPASCWALLPVLELLTCGVVSFFLARYLARPIGQIRSAAAAFAAGDLTARAGSRLGRRRRDEAADLVRAFDRMADRVAASMQAQQRFIGDVSHEIKSPLARLSLALGLARREAGKAAGPRFDRMERELDTVSRLVGELRVLSSLQGGTAPGRSDPVDLAEAVQEAAGDLTFQWRERARGIRVIRGGNAPLWVRGDGALLRRVAENVLANALFYTPDGTEVEAILDRSGPWARLVVRDRGPGVPSEALPHLFEPFYRVDEARARNTGGVGLGLAICKRAVELHGGRISAVSAAPGLALRIELPALEIGVPAVQPSPEAFVLSPAS
ncbi:MAG: HAMP domain-containing histidine kinase [Acetobacteraceae bacterium]|nr:HAMP domain-containing histidine kinase [Acetobacteraceae bacterium]